MAGSGYNEMQEIYAIHYCNALVYFFCLYRFCLPEGVAGGAGVPGIQDSEPEQDLIDRECRLVNRAYKMPDREERDEIRG